MALRDLDFDHTTGKIADEDYQAQRAGLMGQGVAILKQLDGLGANGHGAGRGDTRRRPALEDEIEAAIAARRRTTSASRSMSRPEMSRPEMSRPQGAPTASPVSTVTCHECGTAARAGDKFCPNCGATLALACPNCGQPYVAGDKFCGKCGTSLAQPVEAM